MEKIDRSPEDFARRDAGLRALVDAYRPMVAATCARYLRRPADVDDAVQETFLRLFRHGAGQPIESVPAWLTRVAQTVCLDAIRRRGSDRRRVDEAAIVVPRNRPEPGERLRHDAIEARLALAMRQLPESDQRLIADRFVTELPLRTIAARTGQSIATVSRRASAAVQQLGVVLREMGAPGTDEHLLAEYFADPAYAASRDLSDPDSPLRLARHRRALELSLRRQTFAFDDGAIGPAIVGPLMPGWTRPIRVGAFVSHASILAVGHRGSRISVENQVASTALLADPRFELVAIVEPRTTHFGPVERAIRDYELHDGLIEATDAGGLASLDVILFGISFATTPAIIDAVRTAVSDGAVGLLKESWVGLGHVPRMPPNAGDLMLAGSPIYVHHTPGTCMRPVDAIVSRRASLLGYLPVGTRLRASGCCAAYVPAPGATVLIQRVPTFAADEHRLPGIGTLASPLYLTGTIGRGRAVVVNDTTHPPWIRKDTFGPGYLTRLLAWLAEPRRER